MGSIALYPVLFFRSPDLCAATFFRALTVRARASLSFGIRESIQFAQIAMRKVNYIMRTSFRAIAIVSNVSRRGILNIIGSAIFQS